MKVEINEEACIACGVCVAIAPEVFELADTDEGETVAKVIMDPVTPELEDDVRDAIEGCPTGAILEI